MHSHSKEIVSILLGTYNGGKFLREQLDSILAQTYSKWKLIIRDDGSSDKTIPILKNYKQKVPENIILLEDNKGTLGPCLNFRTLLESCSSEYFMFCDQDDVWLPKKVEMTFKEVKKIENQVGKATPILVFTNTKVSNAKLEILSDSFWSYFGKSPRHTRINYLLMQNTALGCTMMINRSLKELCSNMPDNTVMHDWWATMTASLHGKVSYLDEVTMIYRIHADNITAGKTDKKLVAKLKKALDILFTQKKANLSQEKRMLRAKTYYNCFKNDPNINKKELALILEYSNIKRLNVFRRKQFLIKNRLYCGNIWDTVKEIFFH